MLIARSHRLNIDAVLKLIILLGFAIFFAIIVKSGKILLYVNPRIVPYVKFGIVAMIIISIFYIRDFFRPKRKVNIASYLFFIIPLLLAFLLPAKPVDSSSMAFGDIKLTQKQNGSPVKNAYASNNSRDTAADTTTASPDTGQSSDLLNTAQPDPDQSDSGLYLRGDTVVVDDNNFYRWLEEIYNNMEKYKGKKIETVGFVLKSKKFSEDEFVPARLMMACCTADLQPVGFLCRYSKAAGLQSDTWLKVTGTIEITKYDGQNTPVIIADKVENAPKPENEYVYPYF
jgi:putative membrane protein